MIKKKFVSYTVKMEEYKMSDKVKLKIGDELYNKILEKGLKPDEFDIVNDGSYIPKSRFNEVNEAKKLSDEKVTTYEKQLNETKDLLKGSEEFKSKYSELSKKYKDDLALKDKAIADTSKKYLVEAALMKEGAKHSDLLLGKINLDNLTVEGNNVLGLTDVMKELKTSYKDLFVEKVSKTKTNNKGDNAGSNPLDFQNIIDEAGNSGGDIDWGEYASKL
jgi:dsDNA-specific endonuclease/ATPase MutS2